MFTYLCLCCLNTYVDRTQLEDHMSSCNEQEKCNKSVMNPNKKIKLKDWCMQTDPSVSIDLDLDCMHISPDNPQQKNI